MQFLSPQKIIIFVLSVLLSACSTSEFKAEALSLDCSSAYTRCSPQVQPLELEEVIVQLVDYQSDVAVIEEVPVVIPDIAPLLFGFDKSNFERKICCALFLPSLECHRRLLTSYCLACLQCLASYLF